MKRGSILAGLLVVVIALLIQAGSALAVLVIDRVGVVAALWLRTAFAAGLLVAVRPSSVRKPWRRYWAILLALTFSLVAMNLSFYEAISRAPVGLVVTIEFLGPLGVAVAGSRKVLDLVWAGLAAAGVALLAHPGGAIQGLGLTFALIAACSWAAFIVLAKRAVSLMEPLQVATLMLLGATVMVTPLWLATGIRLGGQGRAVLLGLAVAVLSSAAPYFLELVAIKRVRASTYGVLLSIEPAVAALMGFVILSQGLGAKEIGGIFAVVIAAAGASWLGEESRQKTTRESGEKREQS
ncbi:MAG: EamA family transporter [Thermoleophilia bacterium]|nr:EamA family transporter [Thermoleophilia bacterium]